MITAKDQDQSAAACRPRHGTARDLLLIAEGLHVLNPAVYEAIDSRDQDRLMDLVRHQVNAGAQALDVNLGPGRTMGSLTPWVLSAIRQVADLPLFLSARVLSLPQVLESYRGELTINAVTADPEFLPQAMKTARQYGAGLVVLLVRPGLVPAGIDGRDQLAMEVLDQAVKNDLPLEQLYLDPVIGCRPDPVAWEVSHGLPEIGPVLEAITLIKELSNDLVRTIVGLGSGSQGLARGSRSALHCRLLPLLAEAGLDAVIMNCLDRELMVAARAIKDGTCPALPADRRPELSPAC
ncbi:hypothetical protein MNBD_DELTA04-1799 [hydrothermal vent metagenome]|uniref:Pterin-binding domain-containing protein n=1 Tax=hydrothermal vent metagenome TaxID=652676 RepID=A0A3B0VHZ2_9ZZZZ